MLYPFELQEHFLVFLPIRNPTPKPTSKEITATPTVFVIKARANSIKNSKIISWLGDSNTCGLSPLDYKSSTFNRSVKPAYKIGLHNTRRDAAAVLWSYRFCWTLLVSRVTSTPIFTEATGIEPATFLGEAVFKTAWCANQLTSKCCFFYNRKHNLYGWFYATSSPLMLEPFFWQSR